MGDTGRQQGACQGATREQCLHPLVKGVIGIGASITSSDSKRQTVAHVWLYICVPVSQSFFMPPNLLLSFESRIQTLFVVESRQGATPPQTDKLVRLHAPFRIRFASLLFRQLSPPPS